MSFASACVPDQLLNCHPFASLAGNGEFFLRPFSVNDDDVHWGDPQATLLRMRPDDLLETEVENSFDEWITDCPRVKMESAWNPPRAAWRIPA